MREISYSSSAPQEPDWNGTLGPIGQFVANTLRLWDEAARLPEMAGVRFDIAKEILERTYSVKELVTSPELPRTVFYDSRVAGIPFRANADDQGGPQPPPWKEGDKPAEKPAEPEKEEKPQ